MDAESGPAALSGRVNSSSWGVHGADAPRVLNLQQISILNERNICVLKSSPEFLAKSDSEMIVKLW